MYIIYIKKPSDFLLWHVQPRKTRKRGSETKFSSYYLFSIHFCLVFFDQAKHFIEGLPYHKWRDTRSVYWSSLDTSKAVSFGSRGLDWSLCRLMLHTNAVVGSAGGSGSSSPPSSSLWVENGFAYGLWSRVWLAIFQWQGLDLRWGQNRIQVLALSLLWLQEGILLADLWQSRWWQRTCELSPPCLGRFTTWADKWWLGPTWPRNLGPGPPQLLTWIEAVIMPVINAIFLEIRNKICIHD